MHPPQQHRALNRSGRVPRVVRGYVLLPVVLAMTLIAAIAFLLNTKSPMQVHQVASQRQTDQARYITEAGLNHALWQTRQAGCGPYSDNTNEGFANGSYTTTLTTDLGSTNSYTLSVDQDAWIRSDLPTENKAIDTKLHIRYEGGTIERPMYRYDLSSIAANASILSATAWFYVSKAHPEGPAYIHRLTADWTESDATWDTMGDQMDTVVLATIPTQPNQDVWVSVNLTAQVQAWVNGQANYGITLNSTSEGTHGDYASRETAQQPYLEVIVGIPPSSPATLQSVGKLANGVSRTTTRSNVTLYQFPTGILELQPDAAAGKDTWISEWKTTWNYGKDDSISVDGDGTLKHGLLQFDLSVIPAGAKVMTATLDLYQNNTSSSGGTVEIRSILSNWTEGTQWASTGVANWSESDTGVPWVVTGGDYSPSTFARTTLPAGVVGWFQWDVTSLVGYWVAGTYSNHGLALMGGGSINDFTSSDASDSSLHPKLTITYACECGSACLAPQGSGRIALIGDDSTPDPDDQLKIGIIESWGYEVDFYEDQDSGSIDWSNYDLAYVSETVISGAVNTNLTNLSIGVVNEEPLLYPDMAQGNGFGNTVDSSIDISDNSHYITAPFALGALPIYAGGMEILTLATPLPTGTRVLAENGGDSAVTVLDQGAINNWGNPSPGRRVTLPLGRHFASDFNWTYLNNNGRLIVQRSIAWAMGADDTSIGSVLLVVADAASLSSKESAGKALMESWGYTVTTISASASQADYDTALASVDVAYISGTISSAELGSKLAAATVGVVSEDSGTLDDMGMAEPVLVKRNTQFINIVDNTHYVTSGLSIGDLAIVSSSIDIWTANGTLAPGLQVLGETQVAGTGYPPGVAVLETGAALYGGGNAAGRRVQVPWSQGSSTFDLSALTADGLNIMQRAIEWAAGTGTAATGPLAHWKLDETSGPTAVDSEGGHDGTLAGNPTWSTGTLDGALDFDGSGDRIDVGSILDGGSPQISVTAWIFKRDTGDDRVISKSSGTAIPDHIFSLGLYGTTIRVRLRTTDNGGTSDYDGGAIPLDQWVHVAFTYDGAQLRIYKDGTETASYAVTGDMIASTQDIAIGNVNATDDRYWNGLLDDVRIYDTALSASEVAELANPGAVTGPIAHWKMDETAGSTAVDSEGGHNGTLVGDLNWGSGEVDGALMFDGLDDRVNVPHAEALSLTDAFTLSAWVNSYTLSGYDLALNKGTSGNNQNYWFGTFDDEITFGFYTGTWQEFNTSGLNLQLNTWYHIAATFDDTSDQVRVYLDGSEVLSTSTTVSPTPNTEDLQIGRSQHGEYWGGKLDDIRIYDRVLSAAEVADLASPGGGGGSPPAGPVFEEFTEATLDSNGTNLTISKPPGTADGDLLVAAVATDGNNKSSLAPPAGWNVINVDDRGGKVTFGVWWKLAGASESNNYTFNWSNGEQAYGWIMRFTGHDPTSPIDVDSKDEGKTASPSSPSVTTTVNNTLILRLGGFDDDDITAGNPGLSGHTATNMGNSGSGTGTASGGSGYVLQAAAGASGTSSFALTASEEYVTVTIAIAPAQ